MTAQMVAVLDSPQPALFLVGGVVVWSVVKLVLEYVWPLNRTRK